MAQRASKAIVEWKAALDATLALDFVGTRSAVGYWGVSMGTAIGMPFVASEPRIQCAVFGLAGLRPGATEFAEAAKRIRIPVQFVFQWKDAVAPREHGIALFDAFGSEDRRCTSTPRSPRDPGVRAARLDCLLQPAPARARDERQVGAVAVAGAGA
jgi:dienelactone hydrolase